MGRNLSDCEPRRWPAATAPRTMPPAMLSPHPPPASLIAAALGVSARTARRWLQTRRFPDWSLIAWAALAGDLGAFHPDWRGYRLVADRIVTPEGAELRPGDLAAIPLRQQYLAELEKQLRGPRQLEL